MSSTSLAPFPALRRELARVDGSSFTAMVAHHWPTGRTRYRLSGPRVEGTFTISPDSGSTDSDDPGTYYAARVAFGWPGDDENPFGSIEAWQDRPRVNGVTLWGSVSVTDWSTVPHDRRRPDWAWYISRGSGTDAPEATQFRTAQLCCAILTLWQNMPEWPALVRARLTYLAPLTRARLTDEALRLDKKIAELRAEADTVRRYAGAWSLLADHDLIIAPERFTPDDRN
jgi:hypothetical protein